MRTENLLGGGAFIVEMRETSVPMTVEQHEHTELILASKKGDRNAMTELINIYSTAVHNLIFSIIRDASAVQDLAQETFVRMFLNIKNYEFRAPFRAWLFRIAVNLCRDHLRKKKVRNIMTPFQRDPETGEQQVFVDESADPIGSIEGEERMTLIHKAIEKLPQSSRIVLVMRELEQLSYEEIADILNWKIGTVKSRLFRARRELAAILRPHLEELR